MELLFFVPAIVVLGVMTSYTDIFTGKIRNKHIIAALAFIPVAYAVLMAYSSVIGIEIRFSYLSDLAVNMAIALVFGFFAWHMRMWSAADAKLFLAYSGLVPLTAYSNAYIAYFPSFILLVNTFFPIFIFYGFKSVISTSRKEKMESLKKMDSNQVLSLVSVVFLAILISRILVGLVRVDIGFLGSVLLMMSALYVARNNVGVWKSLLFVVPLAILIDYSYLFSLDFLFRVLVFSLILVPVSLVIIFSEALVTKLVKVRDLRPGMVLSDNIYLERGKYKRMEAMEAQLGKGIEKDKLLDVGMRPEGLTIEDSRKIKLLHERGRLDFEGIKVKQTLPFSPFMFLGVVLTLLAQGNFIALFI